MLQRARCTSEIYVQEKKEQMMLFRVKATQRFISPINYSARERDKVKSGVE